MKYLAILTSLLLSFPCFAQRDNLQAIVLAAGKGSRFKTGKTKLCIPICGKPMVCYTTDLLASFDMPMSIIIGCDREQVKETIIQSGINAKFVVQEEQLGTGHALLCSRPTWRADNLLLMNSDMPLITQDILERLINEHTKAHAAISFIVAYNVDPTTAYGRIVRDGNSIRIVEAKHFTYDIRDYPYFNVGIYLINRAFLENFIDKIEINETTQEFYVTDLVELASNNNLPVVTVQADPELVHGVNNFKELAHVEQIIHDQLITTWMLNGVRFILPQTTYLHHDVKIGAGTVIEPGVQLLNGTTIGKNCTIGAHSTLDGATIADHQSVSTSRN